MKSWCIRNWSNLYENHRSRKLKRPEWVPLPNSFDGRGYIELMDHPNGTLHYGVWCLVLAAASRMPLRGLFVSDSGRAHDLKSLAGLTRGSRAAFEEAMPRILETGWIEEVDVTERMLHEIKTRRHELADAIDTDDSPAGGVRVDRAKRNARDDGRDAPHDGRSARDDGRTREKCAREVVGEVVGELERERMQGGEGGGGRGVTTSQTFSGRDRLPTWADSQDKAFIERTITMFSAEGSRLIHVLQFFQAKIETKRDGSIMAEWQRKTQGQAVCEVALVFMHAPPNSIELPSQYATARTAFEITETSA
jgi:hypothetical protein